MTEPVRGPIAVETHEGAQELMGRRETDPVELRREQGGVLRLPEGIDLDAGDIDIEVSEDETMIINMGPQHPSTHGVLRLMLELDGETVLRSKPIVGYLHTGMEKTGEELMYIQGGTNVTRMDYLAPLFNECVYSMAIERLLESPRADASVIAKLKGSCTKRKRCLSPAMSRASCTNSPSCIASRAFASVRKPFHVAMP